MELLASLGLAYLLFVAGSRSGSTCCAVPRWPPGCGRSGSFVAGVAVSAISDRAQGTGATRMKVEVIGFGLLVPIFFVTAGVQFDLAALASSTADLVLVPPKWCPASLDVFPRRDA